jgi:hypothetical protein
MLGTGIASANENVNPDLPPSPIDSPIGAGIGQLPSAPIQNSVPVQALQTAGTIGTVARDTAPTRPPTRLAAAPIQAIGVASAPPDTEEAASLDNMYTTAGDRPLGDTDATNMITTQVQRVRGGDAEWEVLSGNLFDPPVTRPPAPATTAPPNLVAQLPADGHVFRVPFDVVGRVVGHSDARAPQAADEFGPSDSAFQLLGANQVPMLADLSTVPRRPGQPALDSSATQVFPVIGETRPAVAGTPTVADLPTPGNTPYQPVSGELPVSGSLPTVNRPTLPQAPTLTTPSLPGLPPVPTLPVMPAPHNAPSTHALPAIPFVPTVPAVPSLSVPHVSGPLAGGLPTTQDAPAGAAQQLMAQLRGLISELENSGSGQLHRLNVTALQAPDLRPPTL